MFMIELSKVLVKRRTGKFLPVTLTAVENESTQVKYRQGQSNYWMLAIVTLGIGILNVGGIMLYCYCR